MRKAIANPKESFCCSLPLHTHADEYFHHPQSLKLVSSTHTEQILFRVKKHKNFQ